MPNAVELSVPRFFIGLGALSWKSKVKSQKSFELRCLTLCKGVSYFCRAALGECCFIEELAKAPVDSDKERLVALKL